MNPAGIGASFEHFLGSTSDGSNPFSLEAAFRNDRENAFPEQAHARLVSDGHALRLIPQDWGGKLLHYQALHMQARCLTRRHMALMPATLYGIGPLTALTLAGTDDQKREALDDTARGCTIAFGLSESRSGSDMEAIDTRASPDAGQWTLSGHKWIVGSADRARHMAVLARTREAGPASSSLFWIPTQDAALTIESAEPMLGMRGIHFSGVRFDHQKIAASSMIGLEGQGLELALTCQQPIRILSTAANLGACDTVLRIAMESIRQDRGRRQLSTLPHVRFVLASAFADLLMLDAVTQAAARSPSFAPEQCSLTSSVAKYAALRLSRQIMECATLVMGSRALLEAGPWRGAFVRARRDNEMLEAIDNNPVQNLRAIAMQLNALTAGNARLKDPPDTAWFDLDASCPSPMIARLRLFNRMDIVTESLPMIIERVRESARTPPQVRDELVHWLSACNERHCAMADDLRTLRQREGQNHGNSIALIRHAEHHARIHMAASATLAWLHSSSLPAPLQSGAWLVLALQRLYAGARPDMSPPASRILEETWSACEFMSLENLLYSLTPFRLQS